MSTGSRPGVARCCCPSIAINGFCGSSSKCTSGWPSAVTPTWIQGWMLHKTIRRYRGIEMTVKGYRDDSQGSSWCWIIVLKVYEPPNDYVFLRSENTVCIEFKLTVHKAHLPTSISRSIMHTYAIQCLLSSNPAKHTKHTRHSIHEDCT